MMRDIVEVERERFHCMHVCNKTINDSDHTPHTPTIAVYLSQWLLLKSQFSAQAKTILRRDQPARYTYSLKCGKLGSHISEGLFKIEVWEKSPSAV